ncbi:10132_t:CDS:2 [Ambispora gerdemannii]|uniref:10132_t:CDS:1 n=1 Tax=Ambispora gerdemannii TaxID=144530 RepID=A0A9N8V503_9GLOM|nr:10132_t:CDS:2 [Ambispora gerdemannii]
MKLKSLFALVAILALVSLINLQENATFVVAIPQQFPTPAAPQPIIPTATTPTSQQNPTSAPPQQIILPATTSTPQQNPTPAAPQPIIPTATTPTSQQNPTSAAPQPIIPPGTTPPPAGLIPPPPVNTTAPTTGSSNTTVPTTGSSNTTAPTTGSSATTTSSPAKPASTMIVDIDGNTFTPNILKAQPGDVIVWNWKNGSHSLIQSTMSNPCSKKANVLFYCGVKNHCKTEKMIINAPAGFSWQPSYTVQVVIATAPPSSDISTNSAGIQHPMTGQRMLLLTVTCASCQKTTWAGCGRHIQYALKGVAEEDLCRCKKTNTSSNKEVLQAKPKPSLNEQQLSS